MKQGELSGTCSLVAGCRFGAGPEAIDATQGELITGSLLISFILDPSDPLFDIAAGELVPGLSVAPQERLASYEASAISNLSATFAGIDLVTDPRFGLSNTGFNLGPGIGVVPGALLIEGVDGVGAGPELDMIFGTQGRLNSSFIGSFIAAGNTRPTDRNRAVDVDDNPVFGFGDANGVFSLASGNSGTFTVATASASVPTPGSGMLFLSGIVVAALIKRVRVSRPT